MSKEIYGEIKLVACCRRLALWVWPDSPVSALADKCAMLHCLQSSGQLLVSGISRGTRYVTHVILAVPDNDILIFVHDCSQ
jgi:hypothetical protein